MIVLTVLRGKDNITDLLNSDHIEVSPFAAFNEIEINAFDIEQVFSEMSHGEPIKSINKLSSYIKDNQNEVNFFYICLSNVGFVNYFRLLSILIEWL